MSGLLSYTVVISFVVALSSLVFAIVIEAIFNAGGWMREWGRGAETYRMLTVKRNELRFTASWIAILTTRVATGVLAVSLLIAALVGAIPIHL
jgi:hypothetical protein